VGKEFVVAKVGNKVEGTAKALFASQTLCST
jgi:hypothetical protein